MSVGRLRQLSFRWRATILPTTRVVHGSGSGSGNIRGAISCVGWATVLRQRVRGNVRGRAIRRTRGDDTLGDDKTLRRLLVTGAAAIALLLDLSGTFRCIREWLFGWAATSSHYRSTQGK
jgi:hypothetical protein